MENYLKIKTVEKVKDDYGFHLKITKIGLYDKNGKWIRWVKLNDDLIEFLKNSNISLK